ncbi:hypothetical protein HII31_02077 [Pseudocercospora fuligena]|uniref:Uncharacterized protein n=1 Tax=Pseudocercospora fuligena TaxID=685502 RepID=A0A8H6VNF7_9PEZI|nr:hypothetical protein HII31_02077 [Pseudocercospora fuligena]
MTKAGQWEIDHDNSKGKARDSLKKQERRADAAEAYQKEASGGKEGQDLTAEHVKSTNRASGSTDPPEYDEVGSNTKAEAQTDSTNEPVASGSATAASNDNELAIVIRDGKTIEDQGDKKKGPERATVTTPVTEDDAPD